jgi:hypothetical protein
MKQFLKRNWWAIALWLIAAIFLFVTSPYSQPRLGMLVEEADGTPAGYVYKFIMTNGSLSIANSVGTLTIGGNTALDDVTDPDAAKVFAMGAHELTFGSATDQWGGLLIDNTQNTLTGESILLTLKHAALKTDTNATYLSIIADSDGTPVEVFEIKGAATRPQITGDASILASGIDFDAASALTIAGSQIDFDDMAGSAAIATTSTINGLVQTTLDTDATVDLSSATGADGEWRVNNDDDVIQYTLPPAALGLTVCFYDHSANGQVISIDPDDATDAIYLNGASVGAGDEIDSPGDRGDYVCLLALDGDTWVTTGQSGTWVDGGAS